MKSWGILNSRLLLACSISAIAASPSLAQTQTKEDAPIPTNVAVQLMMDKLFPKIEKPALRSSDEEVRINTTLRKLIAEGLEIDFNSNILNCAEPTAVSCRIAHSGDPLQRNMVIRYAIGFMDELGLSGSGLGNYSLPAQARQRHKDVHYWINWSQCYQPPAYPRNAISCDKAFYPFSRPSPGVRAVFQTRGDRVLSIIFYMTPDTSEAILAERARLEKTQQTRDAHGV